jgi:predicted RND superfamily exporter protein
MGATIDYGILLSTSYVRARQNLDRKDALEEALNTALPTVFTSGIILMICGLVVGLVASQTSISSVGFLLCRGTLVSCIMIVFVLPSILYLLDKIVVKLTIQKSLVEIVRSIGKK